MKKLPKVVFVAWVEEGVPDNEPYLIAAEDWTEHVELSKRRVVGTYQLVETSEVIAETKKRKVQRK